MKASLSALSVFFLAHIPCTVIAGGFSEPVVESVPAERVMTISTPTAADWSGFYGGLSYNTVDAEFGNQFVTIQVSDEPSLGFFAGYNAQIDNFVYGGEVNITTLGNALDGYSGSAQRAVIEVRGRVGFTPIDTLLMYGFGGYAMSGVYTQGFGETLKQDGVSYGIGADYLVKDNIFVGIELAQRDVAVPRSVSSKGYESRIQTLGFRVGYNF